ncbi:Uncharacterised protein [Klebsiella pneumoniae]|uniref:Uncharacterized protein n=1 Tax=Klebsiella pneumoniae TaxID=573 RepID=A0A509AFY5_KLEPN|nr:hypothetical protein EOBFOGIL_00004 [Escherichia coli]WOL84998.1 hypothetical protein LCGCLEKF_00004 [Escherichia coli]VUA85607.1 Uncharacterised protein [Klebsiella pneumoniae]
MVEKVMEPAGAQNVGVVQSRVVVAMEIVVGTIVEILPT